MNPRTLLIILLVCFLIFVTIQYNRIAFNRYFDNIDLGERHHPFMRNGEYEIDLPEIMREYPLVDYPEDIIPNARPNMLNGAPVEEHPHAVLRPMHYSAEEQREGVPNGLIIEEQREGVPSVIPPVRMPDIPPPGVEQEEKKMRILPRAVTPPTDITSRLPRNISRGQRAASIAIEKLTGHTFQFNVRPFFLRSPITGRNLELDCYNAELKIGVEYNGMQHYIYPNYFHHSEAQFHTVVKHDVFKQRRCRQLGIYLIIIPYTVDESSIEAEARRQLTLRYQLPQ